MNNQTKMPEGFVIERANGKKEYVKFKDVQTVEARKQCSVCSESWVAFRGTDEGIQKFKTCPNGCNDQTGESNV